MYLFSHDSLIHLVITTTLNFKTHVMERKMWLYPFNPNQPLQADSVVRHMISVTIMILYLTVRGGQVWHFRSRTNIWDNSSNIKTSLTIFLHSVQHICTWSVRVRGYERSGGGGDGGGNSGDDDDGGGGGDGSGSGGGDPGWALVLSGWWNVALQLLSRRSLLLCGAGG